MYKEKISAWVDAHKDEMLEDICELCRVNSEKMPAVRTKKQRRNGDSMAVFAIGIDEILSQCTL